MQQLPEVSVGEAPIIRRGRHRPRELETERDEVHRNLRRGLHRIDPICFSDDVGSGLFEKITGLPESYQTRTERAPLAEIADRVVGLPGARELVEIGCGAGQRIEILLDAMLRRGRLEPRVLLDSNESYPGVGVEELARRYPGAYGHGVVGDFPYGLGAIDRDSIRLCIFLAGTIDNIYSRQLIGFLNGLRAALGREDAFLAGFNLVESPARLETAYDGAGITAECNLKVLKLLNRSFGTEFEVDAFEHKLIHQETLQYTQQQLPTDLRRRPASMPSCRFEGATPTVVFPVEGGPVMLGADFDAIPIGWDNESLALELQAGASPIDPIPVRNGESLEFLDGGGCDPPEPWRGENGQWGKRGSLEHPAFWTRKEGGVVYRTLFDELPLDGVTDWPVYGSHAEAEAFCRRKGARLPTETQFHRAAHTPPDGGLHRYPWGDGRQVHDHRNLDLRHWSPTQVGCLPGGNSAEGVSKLGGNGWEWTDTVFARYPGPSARIPTCSGYSPESLDGPRQVMLGASWPTPADLERCTFRNWFQRYNQFSFAKFRCTHAV